MEGERGHGGHHREQPHAGVQHCQSRCIEFGPVAELAEKMDEKQQTLFVVD